jgi:hypothetical protein
MRKQELRIGNKIKIDGIIVTVDERTLFDFDHDGRVKESVEITEEWLESFKFENNVKMVNDVLAVKMQIGGAFFIATESNFILLPRLIKHVHQLQNLYFALTGEELQ